MACAQLLGGGILAGVKLSPAAGVSVSVPSCRPCKQWHHKRTVTSSASGQEEGLPPTSPQLDPLDCSEWPMQPEKMRQVEQKAMQAVWLERQLELERKHAVATVHMQTEQASFARTLSGEFSRVERILADLRIKVDTVETYIRKVEVREEQKESSWLSSPMYNGLAIGAIIDTILRGLAALKSP